MNTHSWTHTRGHTLCRLERSIIGRVHSERMRRPRGLREEESESWVRPSPDYRGGSSGDNQMADLVAPSSPTIHRFATKAEVRSAEDSGGLGGAHPGPSLAAQSAHRSPRIEEAAINSGAVDELRGTGRGTGHEPRNVMEETAAMIDLNLSDYTAWVLRREHIRSIGSKFNYLEEYSFTKERIWSDPKCYQSWYHRRWLVSASPSLVDLEFDDLDMLLAEDSKNYNAWQHRKWLVETMFQSKEILLKELQWTENLIYQDCRNNSAWNYRTWLLNSAITSHPEPGSSISNRPEQNPLLVKEILCTTKWLKRCPNDEAIINHLRALFHDPLPGALNKFSYVSFEEAPDCVSALHTLSAHGTH
ncbi:protein prenyltransferase alpha subunit repeat protein [Gregarina niphandrodes]|uniref:Protein farnesyltransferase/geranylgeranyltransferase type-1 subunit alpha n=1 Tax=Gregarina niphandrodes TaxID=110365 RepID=A0A023B411_GRENI|nr:protein prenyltransferase alpha subunit repeat protein [Gregarina niphandrodes]EZG56142.1 protein prenyltransferase alpha subunit repeat protein [Gregarina niphandrodes]|eukprot:XP_011131315.1 protein prenyltransferase alpha subunit repeat protein [Gregarina niphandrodes]